MSSRRRHVLNFKKGQPVWVLWEESSDFAGGFYKGVVKEWRNDIKRLRINFEDGSFSVLSANELTLVRTEKPDDMEVIEVEEMEVEDDEEDEVEEVEEVDEDDDDEDDEGDDEFKVDEEEDEAMGTLPVQHSLITSWITSTGPPMSREEHEQKKEALIAEFEQKNQACEEKLAQHAQTLDPSLQDGFKLQHDFFKKITGGYCLVPTAETLNALLERDMEASLINAQAGLAPPQGYFSEHLKEYMNVVRHQHFGITRIKGQEMKKNATYEKSKGPFGFGHKTKSLESGCAVYDLKTYMKHYCVSCKRLSPFFHVSLVHFPRKSLADLRAIAKKNEGDSVFRNTQELLSRKRERDRKINARRVAARAILALGTPAENRTIPDDICTSERERCTCENPEYIGDPGRVTIAQATAHNRRFYSSLAADDENDENDENDDVDAPEDAGGPPRTVEALLALPGGDYIFEREPEVREFLGVEKIDNKWYVEIEGRKKMSFYDKDEAIKCHENYKRRNGFYAFLNNPTKDDRKKFLDSPRLSPSSHRRSPDIRFFNITKVGKKFRVQVGDPSRKKRYLNTPKEYNTQEKAARAADVLTRKQIADGYLRHRYLNYPKLPEFLRPNHEYIPARGFYTRSSGQHES